MMIVSGTNLDEFIVETRNTLDALSQNFDREWPKYTNMRYEITDILTTQRGQIHLSKFCLETRSLLQYMQIFARINETVDNLDILSLAVYYFKNETPKRPGYNALIFDVNARTTTPKMSGTEIMLLVQYILYGLGVKSCKLDNCAKIRYDYYAQPPHSKVSIAFVPTIALRCIRGMTSDWYSEFGYFNDHQLEIEQEMVRIHNMPYHNTSFGPWLYALWNKQNKRAFHIAYQENLSRFNQLKRLRNRSTWIAYFQ